MTSPSGKYSKNAPPMLVSTSLEGLEIGVPPPNILPVKRSAPCLEKPLPKLPDRTSSIYGEESSIILIQPVVDDPNEHLHHGNGRKRATSDSPEPSGRFYRRRNIDHRNSVTRPNDRPSLTLKTFLLDDYPNGVRPQPAKANHYFREKKWDIFPELAPQSARSSDSPLLPPKSSASSPTKSPSGRPRLPRMFSRQQFYHQGEVFGVNLKPVAKEIQQTIVSKTSQLRLRRKASSLDEASTPVEMPAKLPVEVEVVPARSRNNSSSSSTNDSDTTTLVGIIDSPDLKRSVAMMRQRMREMAPWSHHRPESADEGEGGSISMWKSTSTSVLNLVSSLENKVPVLIKIPKNQDQLADDEGEGEGSISLWKTTSTSVLNLVSSLESKVPVSIKMSKNHDKLADDEREGSISIWKSTSTSVLNLVSSLEARVPLPSRLPKNEKELADGGSISLWKSTSTSVLNLVSSLEAKVPISSKLPKSQSQAADVKNNDIATTTITTTTTTVSEVDDDNDPPSPTKVVSTKPILAIQTHFDSSSTISLPEQHSTNKAAGGIREKNTRYILIALDGVKRKIAAVQAARRRADLKKHIRVVGPIDKYPDGSINQWV